MTAKINALYFIDKWDRKHLEIPKEYLISKYSIPFLYIQPWFSEEENFICNLYRYKCFKQISYLK